MTFAPLGSITVIPLCCAVILHSVDSQDEGYKSRWRSIRIMYFTMFLSSVGEDAPKFGVFLHVQCWMPIADTWWGSCTYASLCHTKMVKILPLNMMHVSVCLACVGEGLWEHLCFCSSSGFTIVITSLWPYLQKVCTTVPLMSMYYYHFNLMFIWLLRPLKTLIIFYSFSWLCFL